MTARREPSATCATCFEPWRTALTFEFEADVWGHARHAPPGLWCKACDRPWLRWCIWERRWRGGPGPVTPEELGVAS